MPRDSIRSLHPYDQDYRRHSNQLLAKISKVKTAVQELIQNIDDGLPYNSIAIGIINLNNIILQNKPVVLTHDLNELFDEYIPNTDAIIEPDKLKIALQEYLLILDPKFNNHIDIAFYDIHHSDTNDELIELIADFRKRHDLILNFLPCVLATMCGMPTDQFLSSRVQCTRDHRFFPETTMRIVFYGANNKDLGTSIATHLAALRDSTVPQIVHPTHQYEEEFVDVVISARILKELLHEWDAAPSILDKAKQSISYQMYATQYDEANTTKIRYRCLPW